MRSSEPLALAIFSSYFVFTLLLFFVIAKSLSTHAKDAAKWRLLAFAMLAIASFAHTWFYMFKFLTWSYTDFHSGRVHTDAGDIDDLRSRISTWLVNTGIYEQAWSAVSFGRVNWWWSEQLCLFTVGAWTTFLTTEGSRHGIKYLTAYMLLGQLVAVSVASNLFYLAISLSQPLVPKRSNSGFATPMLWISVLLALITVALSPFTTQQTFLPNLLAMHILILIPLTSSRALQDHPDRFSISIKALYTLVAVASAALRLRTTALAILSLPAHSRSPLGLFNAAIETLYSHPAQTSIGWDVIWTSISFIVWICIRPTSPEPEASKAVTNAPLALVATSLASVGVATPWVLRRMSSQKDESKAE